MSADVEAFEVALRKLKHLVFAIASLLVAKNALTEAEVAAAGLHPPNRLGCRA